MGKGLTDDMGVEELEETKYYSHDEFKNILRQNKEGDITAMHFNISSLPKNFNEFHTTLALLKLEPDIIGLTETKITTKVNSYYKPHLTNYEFYQSKSSTNSGSAGVFIKNTLEVEIRNDLDISIPGIFETVWFDITHKQRGKNTFGVIYRHHGITDIPFFERRLEASIAKLNVKNTNLYILGDLNINSLLYDKKPNIKSFIDMMHANSTVNLINKPTWFPRGKQIGKPSLLDHFYTNKVHTVKNIGLLVNGISDHTPIIATISLHTKKNSMHSPNPYIRDFRNFDSEKFNAALARFTVSETEDLDTNFYNLHNHFVNCVNHHIPMRKRSKRELKFAMKPWISNSMKKSIVERNRLHRLSRIEHPNQRARITKYNKYKKTLEKILSAAEIKFYSHKMDACQGQSKAMWRVVNEITRRKKRPKQF